MCGRLSLFMEVFGGVGFPIVECGVCRNLKTSTNAFQILRDAQDDKVIGELLLKYSHFRLSKKMVVPASDGLWIKENVPTGCWSG